MLNILELKQKRNQVFAFTEETLKGYIFTIWECKSRATMNHNIGIYNRLNLILIDF